MQTSSSVMAATLPTWLRKAFKGKRAPRPLTSSPAGATVVSAPPISGRIQVQSAEQLLAPPERLKRLRALEELTRLAPAHFEALCGWALRNYAAYVQQLPASEAHHHAGLGGLLDHGLEAAVLALKLRRGHLLPLGAATEVIDAQADLWSYACFTAVLLHDIGKPAVDHKVELFDKHGGELGSWDPWAGPMEAYAYEARFVRNRNYRMHQRAAPLLARFVVPVEGLRWLTAEREVLTAWLSVISGMSEDAGPLGQIIEEADRLSTAADLTGNVPRQTATAHVRPLHERLVTGLRYLIDSQQLPLNRPGAAGWLIADELWLVVKTALDALRAHLLQEGQSGIPGDNRRLMDELQERGVVIPNGGRAVWSARVALGEWQQELTMLRFPVARLWPDPATRPEACHGAILSLAEGSVAAAPGTPPAASQSITTDSQSEPLEPAQANAGEVDERTRPTPTASLAAQVAEAPASATPVDLGQAFLAWLRAGLASGELPINTVNARVHRVREGVLLVSPGIFRDYAGAVQAPWASIQKRFQKLKLHRKTPEGSNIWTYTVTGKTRSNVLKGLVIEEPEKMVDAPIDLPPPNPHLSLRGN